MSSKFLKRLEDAHQRICRQIDFESGLPEPNRQRLTKLEKLRISMKDRMARVKARAAMV